MRVLMKSLIDDYNISTYIKEENVSLWNERE